MFSSTKFSLATIQSSRSHIFGLNGQRFGVLPEEIQMRILRFLSINDIFSCRQLNSHFKDLCDDEELWRELTIQHFDFGVKKIDHLSWKSWYQELHNNVWKLNPITSNSEVRFSENLFHAWVPAGKYF